jgi:hypothetical protein
MSVVEVNPPLPQQQGDLLPLYLGGMRKRFSVEVNRLTTGGMLALLGERPDARELAFPLAYLDAWHWLRHNVDDAYRDAVLDGFRNPARRFLMDLLRAGTAREFVLGYIRHWRDAPAAGPLQQDQLLQLLKARGDDAERVADHLLAAWDSLGRFHRDTRTAYADLARRERERYNGMLATEDRERLALIDALPDPEPAGKRPRLAKLGIIPAMGCPQTCRHCMFVWRPPKPGNADPERLYRELDALSDNVLFTGGDLTRHLDHFYRAIAAMRHVTTFAILLNGDFATDAAVTEEVIGRMAAAVGQRPAHWPRARVLLQISFDEFHQEIHVDKHGQLRERIPVAKIANIVETAPRHVEQVQLALLHKQTALNFSMDVLHKGVFARLVNELGARGHQVRVLSSSPSARLKRNPQAPDRLAPVLKDASFVLAAHPDAPILLTSSTIDAYGRAELLDEGETVQERDLLRQVLEQGAPPGESFDIDLMFWFNGWATLFNAVHICLGDLYRDGLPVILARQRKDPLSRALHRFDRRLLDLYAELRDDLARKVAGASGPHQLFHTLTEDPEVRLHMTRRLIQADV